jgi:hypothetical protein
MKFITNNSSDTPLCTDYKEKHTEEMVDAKFLGLQIDSHLSWKNHIKQSRGACYAIKSMAHIRNINTLKSIYYAHFHSIWNNFFGQHFKKLEDFHFTTEICQNYALCTTQNFM